MGIGDVWGVFSFLAKQGDVSCRAAYGGKLAFRLLTSLHRMSEGDEEDGEGCAHQFGYGIGKSILGGLDEEQRKSIRINHT